jgi:hypothetical protein
MGEGAEKTLGEKRSPIESCDPMRQTSGAIHSAWYKYPESTPRKEGKSENPSWRSPPFRIYLVGKPDKATPLARTP